MRTLTESLDNMYTSTWQNMKKKTQDQVFDASPVWFWLRQHGAFESVPGGRFLTEPLSFAKSDNVKWFNKGGTFSLSAKQFLTVAVYHWRYLGDSIVRFGIEEQQNSRKNEILSLMKSKMNMSKETLIDTLETRLAGTGGTDEMHGFQDIIAIDPTVTAATLGQIDPSVDPWWRNQTKNMTGISFAARGPNEMLSMMNTCSNNLRQDTPNIIFSGQVPWEMYWDATLEQKRIVNKTLGDAGFQNVEFNGTPLVWSGKFSDTEMYFTTTKHLKVKYDPRMFFDMTEWKAIPEQPNDRAAQIVTAIQLATGRRRVHGVLHTIDTV